MKRCLVLSTLWTLAAIFIFESIRWWINGTWGTWMAPVLIYGLIYCAALSDHWPEETP